MDKQPLIEDPRKGLNLVHYGSLLLPSSEYTTTITNFPGNNCIPAWDTRGKFCASFEAYSKGKQIGTVHAPCIDEQGVFECDFDDLLAFSNQAHEGLIIARFWHAPKIPVELYLSHMHRETGTYIAYPALMFMGDLLYPHAHSDQLENSLFWPGLLCSEQSRLFFAILNPYKLSFSYQVSLFLPDGKRIQSSVMKVQPFSTRWMDVEEIFPEHINTIKDNPGTGSLCVTAQYKTLAYGIVKDRKSGLITTIDHLHTYTMV